MKTPIADMLNCQNKISEIVEKKLVDSGKFNGVLIHKLMSRYTLPLQIV